MTAWEKKVYDSWVGGTAAIIIIRTRWSEDDLNGRLFDPDHPEHDPSQAKAWTYLNVPAVLKPGPLAGALGAKLERSKDPDVVAAFGHEPIAALWPEGFPLRHLARAKALDPLGCGAPYPRSPTRAAANYFQSERDTRREMRG